MRLKNWSVTQNGDNFFTAPELISYCLEGEVYGHPRFNDGDSVVTSRITEVNDKGDHKEVVTRSGSVYELYKEDVDPRAEEMYPGYYERFVLKYV